MRVLVIGAGIVGCGIAYELAGRGVEVTVLERGDFGEQAATPAAAGMLGAQLEDHPSPVMLRLCVASRSRYADWAGALTAETGIDVDYRRCGALVVGQDEARLAELRETVERQRAEGLTARMIDGAALRELEPALSERLPGAAHFPDDGRIDPPSLLRATRAAAEKRGARFRFRTEVAALALTDARVTGVTTREGERLEADEVVVAGGSWSTQLGGLAAFGVSRTSVEPVRGQIVELSAPVLGGLVDGPGAYLSPRSDGRLLVGATVEHVGFERAVTPAGVLPLLSAAIALVPALAEAPILGLRSGFRAQTPDGLPILGRVAEGLLAATGHYRNGVVLAPLTALCIAELVTGAAPTVDLAPFSATRFRA
ncbi:MAG: glycine oxidase ThiO [Polyangiaceae bacterium]